MTNNQNRPRPDILFYIELSVIIGLLLFYASSTYKRNFIWKDNLSLWTDVVNKSPAKARPRNYLGLAYFENSLIDKAIIQYKQCISLNPFYSNAYSNLGVAYFKKGLVDRAITYFKYAIKISPDHADAHYNLGIAYGEKGLTDEAYSEMRKGMELRLR